MGYRFVRNNIATSAEGGEISSQLSIRQFIHVISNLEPRNRMRRQLSSGQETSQTMSTFVSNLRKKTCQDTYWRQWITVTTGMFNGLSLCYLRSNQTLCSTVIFLVLVGETSFELCSLIERYVYIVSLQLGTIEPIDSEFSQNWKPRIVEIPLLSLWLGAIEAQWFRIQPELEARDRGDSPTCTITVIGSHWGPVIPNSARI
jgi:hypothetical protein